MQVIELKGNIRVLCRVRPLLSYEAQGLEPGVLPLDEELVRVAAEKGEKDFEFDRVFAPEDGQLQVCLRCANAARRMQFSVTGSYLAKRLHCKSKGQLRL